MLSQDEIDSLLSSLSTGSTKPAVAVAENPGEPAAPTLDDILRQEKQKNYKLYNFRRPDKFSKDHLRALQTIHETFARQVGLLLTAFLRMHAEIEVVSVDQLTYDEFVRSMPRPITVGVLEFHPLPGKLLFGLGFEITMCMVNRMLGGNGEVNTKPREMTDIELSLVKRILDRVLSCLEDAWRSVLDVSISLDGLEESYSLIQISSPGEIVALVTLEVTLGGKDNGLMSLCIPYPVLEEVLNQFSNQHIFHKQTEQRPQDQEQLLYQMNYARLPINVVLGGGSLTVRDLLQLEVDDVIKLDRNAHSDLLLCVNGTPKFFCRPGTRKDKVAVRITDAVERVEALQGFGLGKTPEEEERFL